MFSYYFAFCKYVLYEFNSNSKIQNCLQIPSYDLSDDPRVLSLMTELVKKFPTLDPTQENPQMAPSNPLPNISPSDYFTASVPATFSYNLVPITYISSPQATPRPSHPLQPPAESYVTIIGKALMSVLQQEMIVGEIYRFFIDYNPYFFHATLNWRSTVRHNLSVNPCFVSKGKAGRLNLWGVHPAYLENFSKGIFTKRMANRPKIRQQRSTSGVQHHHPYTRVNQPQPSQPVKGSHHLPYIEKI